MKAILFIFLCYALLLPLLLMPSIQTQCHLSLVCVPMTQKIMQRDDLEGKKSLFCMRTREIIFISIYTILMALGNNWSWASECNLAINFHSTYTIADWQQSLFWHPIVLALSFSFIIILAVNLSIILLCVYMLG